MPDVTHLLVDARPVEHPTARQRGIGRYVTGLIAGLHDIGAPFTALIDTDLQAATLTEAVPGVPVARWSPSVMRDSAPGTWFVATQLMLHPVPLDPIPAIVTDARLPVAAVMYDVIPHRYPERYLTDPFARRLAQIRTPLARTVDTLLAISQFAADTAADELAYPIERIAVIGAGVEARFQPAITPPQRPGCVIAVTGGDSRKNTEGLLRAWAKVQPAVRAGRQLVIVAAHAPAVARRWHDAATAAGLHVGTEVMFTGAVSDDHLIGLLQHAELAVMPSIEEGFGLPVLEAAACGVPAICSRVSSLPEVLDLDEATFDPHDTGAMTVAITKALTDDEYRARLRNAGSRAVERWQWSKVASDTVDALNRLGPRWPHMQRRPVRRLALLAPMASSPSGIGPYTTRIADAWDRLGNQGRELIVDRFVDTSGDPTPTAPHGFPVRAVGRSVAVSRHDHIVAMLGSSHHHVATAHVAARLLNEGWPVHLWLHEASLVGVYLGLAHASGSETWARQLLHEHLVANEPAARRSQITDVLDAEQLHRNGVTLLAEIARRAASIIVSTDAAADTVRHAIRTNGATPPPILVVPLAFPPVTVDRDRTPPPGHDVVSLGWLAPNKAPDLILEAFAQVDPLPSDARLIFAGPIQGDVAEQLRLQAKHLGLADRLIITGRLDEVAYAQLIASARVGIQWRRDQHGEQSAAVNDLVAAGVPTLTNLVSTGTQATLDHLGELLTDDVRWCDASQAAMAAAAGWGVDQVAQRLLAWWEAPNAATPSR